MVGDKREKFVTLAERRVNKALDDLRLIGNLSNKNNYEFTESDAKKIIQALEGAVRDVKRKFSAEDSSGDQPFKL